MKLPKELEERMRLFVLDPFVTTERERFVWDNGFQTGALCAFESEAVRGLAEAITFVRENMHDCCTQRNLILGICDEAWKQFYSAIGKEEK